MKKLLLLWGMLMCIFTIGNAQIDFPDVNFKNALLNHDPVIDTNGDGEISEAEAAVVTKIEVSNKGITNLNGIEHFINLEWLVARENELISLNISQNRNLTALSLDYNDIISIDVSNNNLLEYLYLINNDLTSINLSNNPNLLWLYLNGNKLTNIDFSAQTNLTNLQVGGVTSNITTLDLRPLSSLVDLSVSNSINLNTIYATGISLGYKTISGENFLRFSLGGCPNLQFICADPEYLNDIYKLLEQSNQTECMLSDSCDDPNSINSIQGNITYDINNDGCGNENNIPYIGDFSIIASGIEGEYKVHSNENGFYNLFIPDGSYVFTPNVQSTYFSIETTYPSLPILIPNEINDITTNFCIQPLGNFNDLEVNIFPTSIARPGFNATYLIRYKNIGTTTQSGSLTLDYQDNVLAYVSSSPIIDNDTSGQLTWNFTDLLPMEIIEIPLTLVLNKPTDTPSLNVGDILNFTTTITGASDETPENNVMNLVQPVVNSYDPNDKTCLEGDILDPDDVGGYLHYLIRFENEGTADAVNIRVVDIIDKTKLDIESFVPLNASHSFTTTITNGNEVEFIFNDINLPFDDANNDGYVLFKIKTIDTLVLGDEIVNSAAIYFDFNFPIITENSVVRVEREEEETCDIIDLINFNSPNFKEALLNHSPVVDTDGDGEISICEAEAVTELYLHGNGTVTGNEDLNIDNVEGIQYFVNLKNLNLAENRITSIDVTQNVNLESLLLYQNSLTEIDVTQNTNLTYLELTLNSLSEINLSNNVNLEHLGIYGNNLTDIDLSKQNKLTFLSIGENDLTTLDVRPCSLTDIVFNSSPNLQTVFMTGQPFGYLDFTLMYNCPSLEFICADQEYLDDLYEITVINEIEDDISLSSDCLLDCEILDFNYSFERALLSHTPAIDTDGDGEISTCEAEAVLTLSFSEEGLTYIDEIINFTNLTSFSSYGNALKDVNFTSNTQLKDLVISGTYGESSVYRRTNAIDISNNIALENLVLIGNNLREIDLSNKTNLTNIQLSDDYVRSLNVMDCTSLLTLELTNLTFLDAIDISNSLFLEELNISDTDDIEVLDLHNNVALTDLNISGTGIEVLDVNNNVSLTTLNISETDIEVLDLHNNLALTDLNISETDIEFLDCTSSPNLKNLDAFDCNYLVELNASVNSLSTLNIEYCNDLEFLYMKGDHEFYNEENFQNFQLGDAYSLEVICIDPVATYNAFKDYIESESWAFRYIGKLISNSDCSLTDDCEIINFTDSNFKNALLDHAGLVVDTNDDGEISVCEAEAVSILTFTEKNITNIDQISYFTNLTSFSSYGHRLDDVNFSSNIALKNIVISGAYGSSSFYRSTDSVNLSNNTALESLTLIGNDIKDIDLSNKTNLKSIHLFDNDLNSINVSECTTLVTLEIRNDNYYFDALDVSNNPLLQYLNISESSIEALDLINNVALTNLNISNTDIEALDLINNVALTNLNISNTDIEILDLHNNVALTDLNIADTNIEVLDCNSSPSLKNLDASDCSYLVKLDVSVNALNSLNISGCRNLETLYMKGNHEFYSFENFENFDLGDSYDLYSLEIVCIDPIDSFDEFEAYMNDHSYYFNRNGSLNSSTEDCNPTSASHHFSDFFTVYPNPATSYFRIESNETDFVNDIYNRRIYDLTISDFYGRTIDFMNYSSTEDFRSFYNYISLNSYNLVPGIYYLTMNTELGVYTSSIVVE